MRIVHQSLVVVAVLLSAPVLANDWGSGMPSQYRFSNETLQLRAGVGAVFIGGDEYVFASDRTLSHLLWQSSAPVMRGSVDVKLGNGISVSAGGAVAGYGTSYMEDYDWLVPTNNFDDWTHRSQHPDTNLDHFFAGEVALGYDLVQLSDANVRMHAGFKYTDVAWSSYGGSYIYSVNGFRDRVGNFADGEPAIAYRQRLPELFVGVDGEEQYGKLRVGGLLRGGLTVMGNAIDNHWMRDLRIEDNFRVAPTFSAGVDASMSLGRAAELFVAARYDQHFQMRGKAEYIDTGTGAVVAAGDDIAGAGLKTLDLTIGFKGRF